MKYISLFLAVVVLSSLCKYSFAQELKSRESSSVVGYDYINKAKIDAVIFRGPENIKYPYRFNGTCYAYSDEFLEGRVYYNNKEFWGVKLNLNANRDQLCMQMYGTGLIIVLDKKYVKNFSFGERNFINHTPDDGIFGLEYGYYEVLYNGKNLLFKKITQRLNESVDNSASEILKRFNPQYAYYVIRDGKALSVKKKGDFAKIFKSEKSAIKAHIKERRFNLVGKEANDKVFVEIVRFIDKREGAL